MISACHCRRRLYQARETGVRYVTSGLCVVSPHILTGYRFPEGELPKHNIFLRCQNRRRCPAMSLKYR